MMIYNGRIEDDMKIRNVQATQNNNDVVLSWEWPNDQTWNRCVIVNCGSSDNISEELLSKCPVVSAGAYAPSHHTYINDKDTCFLICPAKIEGDTVNVAVQRDNNLLGPFRHHVDVSYEVNYESKFLKKYVLATIKMHASEELDNEVLYYQCKPGGNHDFFYPLCFRNTSHVTTTIKIQKNQKIVFVLSEEQEKYITLT